MAKKQAYEYIGPSYRQAGLEPGDVRKFKPRLAPDGGVTCKIPGDSDHRQVILFYKTPQKFEERWKEVS